MKLSRILLILLVVFIVLTMCEAKRNKGKKKKPRKRKPPKKKYPRSPFYYEKVKGNACPNTPKRQKVARRIRHKEDCRVICDKSVQCLAYGYKPDRRQGRCFFYQRHCYVKKANKRIKVFVKVRPTMGAFKYITSSSRMQRCRDPGRHDKRQMKLNHCMGLCVKNWINCADISWDPNDRTCYLRWERCQPRWPPKPVRPLTYVRMSTPIFRPSPKKGAGWSSMLFMSQGPKIRRKDLQGWNVVTAPTRGICGYQCKTKKCLEFQFDYGTCLLRDIKATGR